MSRALRTSLACAVAAAAWAFAIYAYRKSAQVVFTRDIAPIGYAHCAPCHRPGQAGPFDLLTYSDYRRHGRDIADVVEDRYMPPWKPHARDQRFRGQRSLNDVQIALMRQWVDEGMREGDASDLPPAPSWPARWQLGTPDAVIELDAAYELAASGSDEYRDFVIASPTQQARYVVAWELQPNGRAIHHAILNIDRLGNARRADAEDPAPGFQGMALEGAQSPDGFYLVWAPGKLPARAEDGSAWRLDAKTDLVLELHLQRTGKPERVSPTIGLYYSATPPTRRRISLRIGDPPIDIAPGEADYRIEDSFTLPADTFVLGMFPHAHYLGKKVLVSSRLPSGETLELLRIDDWDFRWQDEYTFASPPLLPKGSTLHMQFSYDNSASNIHNPSHPPRRVRSGRQSLDEMGNVTFQALPANEADLDVLLEAKYRRQLERSPGNADARYNLANTLARRGQAAEAIAQYEDVLARVPSHESSRANLGVLLDAIGRPRDALPHLESVLAHSPEDRATRLAHGHALIALGMREEGLAEYRRVLQEDPSNARARSLMDEASLSH